MTRHKHSASGKGAEMEHPSLSTSDLYKRKGFQEIVHNISRLFPLKVENYILQFLLIIELERIKESYKELFT